MELDFPTRMIFADNLKRGMVIVIDDCALVCPGDNGIYPHTHELAILDIRISDCVSAIIIDERGAQQEWMGLPHRIVRIRVTDSASPKVDEKCAE